VAGVRAFPDSTSPVTGGVSGSIPALESSGYGQARRPRELKGVPGEVTLYAALA